MRWKLCLCLLFIPVLGLAQSQPANRNQEEAAIRELIAHPQQIKRTEDSIFWSGAFPRPQIGSQRIKPFSTVEIEKRKNEKMTLNPERIEVAASGDMAYEFSYGKLEYEVEGQPEQPVAFENALLRVWKKVNGEWRVAALFVRPLDRPFATNSPQVNLNDPYRTVA